MPARPRVGVTTGISHEESRGRVAPRTPYRRALARAGAASVLLHPNMSAARLDREWKRLDGLVLTGGGDVDPARYGARRHPKTGGVTPDRDTLELKLIARALKDGVPILAICRGAQILNVAFGGTLVQDIPSEPGRKLNHSNGMKRPAATHRVTLVDAGSRLSAAAGARAFRVNSYHHQSVRKPGRGLQVVARSPDGIVEAVEPGAGGPFVIAVQWHPEKSFATDPVSRRIFRSFVAACRCRKCPCGCRP